MASDSDLGSGAGFTSATAARGPAYLPSTGTIHAVFRIGNDLCVTI